VRTDEEILARIAAVKDTEMFGYQTADLMSRLSFDAALKSGQIGSDTTAEGWKIESRLSADLLATIKDYMAFGWDKATGHRGLSAERTIDHYRAWIWLLGDVEYDAIDWENYRNYGAPILMQICLTFELPLPNRATLRSRAHNMATGMMCVPGCRDGCGGEDPEQDEPKIADIESVDQPQLPEKSS
jgi:hypothetical protein